MELLLETRSVKKYYGREPGGKNNRNTLVRAVDGVSLKIEKGRSLALIGESGSGKTTFGKLVCGLERASSGSILFLGQEIQDLREKEMRPYREHLQMVFQSSGSIFDPSYTIGESICEGIRNFKKMTKTQYQEAVDEALRKVGLEPALKKRYAYQLSGGQCQRANLARAFSLYPQLVICDEPVSSLDYSVRKQILNLMNRLQEEYKVTYLLITHDLSNVPYLCSAVAILYQGRVVEQLEETEQLDRRVLHPYSRLLYQSVPVPDPRKRRLNLGLSLKTTAEVPNFEGCLYQNRCPYSTSICKEQAPALREVEAGHWVACHCCHKTN